MKIFNLSLLSFVISITLNAQEFEGYNINKSGDTIPGKVQVPKGNLTIIGSTNLTMGSVTPQSAPDPFKNETK